MCSSVGGQCNSPPQMSTTPYHSIPYSPTPHKTRYLDNKYMYIYSSDPLAWHHFRSVRPSSSRPFPVLFAPSSLHATWEPFPRTNVGTSSANWRLSRYRWMVPSGMIAESSCGSVGLGSFPSRPAACLGGTVYVNFSGCSAVCGGLYSACGKVKPVKQVSGVKMGYSGTTRQALQSPHTPHLHSSTTSQAAPKLANCSPCKT